MAETAQTMTEFTYAPGEKNIVGDRFSPSKPSRASDIVQKTGKKTGPRNPNGPVFSSNERIQCPKMSFKTCSPR